MNLDSLKIDENGIGVMIIDAPDEHENRLSNEAISKFIDFLNNIGNDRKILETDSSIKAIILRSGKRDNFIVGIDLKGLLEFRTADEGREYSLLMQEIIDKLERSRVPFIAAVNGSCHGIGLDICLACRYRVASDDSKTTFGYPEINLGLITGAGTTQRLPQVIGMKNAIDMIVSGKTLNSKQAMETGLIDEVVPREIILEIAKKRAHQLLERKIKPRSSRLKNILGKLDLKNTFGKKILLNNERKKAMRKEQSLNFAPIMAIEAMEIGMNSSFNRGLHVESVYFGELASSDFSRNLINLFLSTSEIKKDPVVKVGDITPFKIEKIVVVGAGEIGSALASVSAEKGFTVRLKDRDENTIGRGLQRCHNYFEERHKNEKITKIEMNAYLDSISATFDYTGFRRADMVIEISTEELDSRQNTLKEIEAITNDDCLISTCSISLPISQIAGHMKRMENVIGMNFFTPVHENQLIEIIVTENTSENTLSRALSFVKIIGKIPIVVKDSPGFFGTRIMIAYINEALHLLSEVGSIEKIDSSMIELGFREGPLMLVDRIGIDEVIQASKMMYEAFGERFKAASIFDILFENGNNHPDNKRVFYLIDKNNKAVNKTIYKSLPIRKMGAYFPKSEIQERLSLAMINEAVLCLEEGIIRSPRDGDIAAVMGLGFPPHLAGPFRFIDNIGAATILDKLENLASKYKSFFEPSKTLIDFAKQNRKFYDELKNTMAHANEIQD